MDGQTRPSLKLTNSELLRVTLSLSVQFSPFTPSVRSGRGFTELSHNPIFYMTLSCAECGKTFTRPWNLKRHKMSSHNEAEEQDNHMNDEDTRGDDTESEMTEEEQDQEEEEEESYDVWEDIREQTLSATGGDVKLSEERLSALRRELTDRYKNIVHKLREVRKDPVHKKIMNTKRRLEEDEGYDSEEALDAAVDLRKYLIYRACNFRDEDLLEDDDDDDGDDGEEEGHLDFSQRVEP